MTCLDFSRQGGLVGFCKSARYDGTENFLVVVYVCAAARAFDEEFAYTGLSL